MAKATLPKVQVRVGSPLPTASVPVQGGQEHGWRFIRYITLVSHESGFNRSIRMNCHPSLRESLSSVVPEYRIGNPRAFLIVLGKNNLADDSIVGEPLRSLGVVGMNQPNNPWWSRWWDANEEGGMPGETRRFLIMAKG